MFVGPSCRCVGLQISRKEVLQRGYTCPGNDALTVCLFLFADGSTHYIIPGSQRAFTGVLSKPIERKGRRYLLDFYSNEEGGIGRKSARL